jgi:hypothetical protein
MSSLMATKERIKAIIDKAIEAGFEEGMERDQLGDSIYLFFLTRNNIESPRIDNLIDWMNSHVENILNQRHLSRFVDRQITSALLGYYSLKLIGRLRTKVDIDKVDELLSKFTTDDSFFNNFTYSVLILLSLSEERNNIHLFNRVLDWVKKSVQRGAFFNDAKNLVFTSMLLHTMNAHDELKALVETCLERVSKNIERFDEKIYYAWVLWNYRAIVEDRDLSKIIEVTKTALENVVTTLGEEMVDSSIMEMYGFDTKPEGLSKILLGTSLDLLIKFEYSRIMLSVPNLVYVEQKLTSLGWREAYRELYRALVAFEDGRMPDCCNNLRMGLITVWIKVCENLEGKSMQVQVGKTVDMGPLNKCLKQHGLSEDSIGMIGRTWSYVSDRAHIEKRGGQAPPESEVRYGVQLTFATVEYLLKFAEKR